MGEREIVEAQEGKMGLIENIINVIDDACAPEKMTKPEAVDFLEQIVTEIDLRIEALREEMAHG